MMRCEEALTLLSDHLNGALGSSEADALEGHLSSCDPCRQTLGELRWVAGLLQGVPMLAVPADLGAKVHTALANLGDVAPGMVSRIPCDEAEDYLTGRIEGDLDEWEATALEGHLEACANCRLALQQLTAVRVFLREVPPEPLPEGLSQRIFAAVTALSAEATVPVTTSVSCETAREHFSEHLDGALGMLEVASLEGHLRGCAECRVQHDQIAAVRALLRAVPQEQMPIELPVRIKAALGGLPSEQVPVYSQPGAAATLTVVPLRRRFNWTSAIVGAAAAVGMFFVWNMQTAKLPSIETAAVSTNTDVAVNIGFDVAQSVDGVTFQIDLPEGLKFVDDKSHPMLAQSVAWRGSLKEGKTVVPVVVRGVRPGRYEIQAYVSKGAMRKKTTIVLPVTGA
jgi:predicted anti-sigma-YlaC factor YlaD